MAGHALNSGNVRSRFSDLAAKRTVDIGDHFHHDASSFLRLFVIRRGIDWNLAVRVRRRACHFDMAMAALDAERHVECLHHLHNLLTCPILRQHLKVDRWSTTTSRTTTTATALAAATFALTLRSDHRREHEQNAENHNSKSRYLAIRHRHLGRVLYLSELGMPRNLHHFTNIEIGMASNGRRKFRIEELLWGNLSQSSVHSCSSSFPRSANRKPIRIRRPIKRKSS